MKINDNKIVDGLTPDGSYQDRVDVQGQERAGTGITADTFNQIIREFQDNYIAKAGIIPLSDDLGQLYKATQYFINQSLLPAVASLEQKLIDTRSLRIGEIGAWAGTLDTIPENAYLCDDSLCLITDHQILFNRIGHSWANGRTPPEGYFYIPDGRGGVLKGAGQSNKYGTYTQVDGTVIDLNEDRGEVGSYQNTAIRNITGETNLSTETGSVALLTQIGVIKGSATGGATARSTGSVALNDILHIDASLVVPVGDTNRDNNLAVNWIIYYKA